VFEIIKPDTHIDFMGRRKLFIGFSLFLLLIGLAAIPLRGIKTGIDFSGGTEIQLRFTGDAPVDEGGVRAATAEFGIEGADVVRFGIEGAREFLVKFQGDLRPPGFDAGAEPDREVTPEERKAGQAAFEAALEAKLGPVEVDRVEFVGPKVGAELRRDGALAMTLSWIAILIYIAFRFSLSYAPGAVIGLIHDVLTTCGLWVLFGQPFDLQVLAALLTLAGYSVNDTIVVYDRIRENLAVRTKHDLEKVVNDALNQTLSRTILTGITTLTALLALIVLGGPVIRPFATIMFIGIVIGTYSSLFVAAPIMIWMEQRRMERAAPATARA
jgi:preprotein translocase subunit SecF